MNKNNDQNKNDSKIGELVVERTADSDLLKVSSTNGSEEIVTYMVTVTEEVYVELIKKK
ncbi:MAG TPA: hypothetical protein PLN13_03360 [Bacteroidia bacterium]|nr:hypothetical protein [Bacteroidia bacterium]HRH07592.1 hypothetical protein [Bacteroidia bacterium]